METIKIWKLGKVVSTSKNLRGILRYAGKTGVLHVSIVRVPNGMGILDVVFKDNAYATTTFEDYTVLQDFLASRKNWPQPRTTR